MIITRIEHDCDGKHGPFCQDSCTKAEWGTAPSYGVSLEPPDCDQTLVGKFKRGVHFIGTLPATQFDRWWGYGGKETLRGLWFIKFFEVPASDVIVGINQVCFTRDNAIELARTQDPEQVPELYAQLAGCVTNPRKRKFNPENLPFEVQPAGKPQPKPYIDPWDAPWTEPNIPFLDPPLEPWERELLETPMLTPSDETRSRNIQTVCSATKTVQVSINAEDLYTFNDIDGADFLVIEIKTPYGPRRKVRIPTSNLSLSF